MRAFAKLQQWERVQRAWAEERNRVAYLRQPLPQDPPELSRPTKVKVLKAFGMKGGKTAHPGEVVTVPWFDAQDLLARARVEII